MIFFQDYTRFPEGLELKECLEAYKLNMSLQASAWFEQTHVKKNFPDHIIHKHGALQWPRPIAVNSEGVDIYESSVNLSRYERTTSSELDELPSVRYNTMCLSCERNQALGCTNNNPSGHVDSGYSTYPGIVCSQSQTSHTLTHDVTSIHSQVSMHMYIVTRFITAC